MPDEVTSWTRFCAWATVVVQIGIIATGGIVRVTGSGLGCPTWPYCTEDSLVNTPEMGIHGVVEFGNRTLTGVLVIVALLTGLAVLRTRGSGRRLVGPAVAIGVLILVQAVIGGLTVLGALDPRLVSIHFLISGLLVAIASVLLVRVRRDEPVPPHRAHPLLVAAATVVNIFTWITVVLGVLTTGSGPHAGDSAAARNGLDPVLMQHMHSYPAYILLFATIAMTWMVYAFGAKSMNRTSVLQIGVILTQMIIGIAQSRMGLPEWMVVLHMLLAGIALCVATMNMTLARRSVAPGDLAQMLSDEVEGVPEPEHESVRG